MNNNKIDINKYNLKDPSQIELLAQEIFTQLDEGMTLQEATGIQPELLEEIYSLAYGYYNVGKFQEAQALFQLIAAASPTVYKYVFGLAAACHQLKLYEDAIAGFFLALNIEESPLAAYYLLDSFLNLNLNEEAEECVELVLELCKDRPEYQNIYKKVKLIKNSLNK